MLQVLGEIFMDPLSEDDVEDHLQFKKMTVTASSKKYLGHRELTLARLSGEKCVKASASRAEDSGFESRLRRDFFGVESYQ